MTIPLTWVRAVRGHEPALDGMTLRCRKTGGQLLASVPRAVRSSRVGEQFAALLEHLDGHEKECRATVESWMLNGLPVPAGAPRRGSSPGCGPTPGGGPACGTWWFRVEGRAGAGGGVRGRAGERQDGGRRPVRVAARRPGDSGALPPAGRPGAVAAAAGGA
ncbi:hypothetical protein [Nonomuraea sp. NPDC005650]|uniref:hypothetical protein n=1 Tax=Nonomuraea sp. NPDC005650 TaxID=3157045 RepID=UPI0033BF56B7